MTSVGGTKNFNPEVAANLSGGGFSFYFDRPQYQRRAVLKYLRLYPNLHDGLFKCGHCHAHCRDLALSYFVCAAVMVVATPTSPHKRSITNLSGTAIYVT